LLKLGEKKEAPVPATPASALMPCMHPEAPCLQKRSRIEKNNEMVKLPVTWWYVIFFR